jgi:hypothetical protein
MDSLRILSPPHLREKNLQIMAKPKLRKIDNKVSEVNSILDEVQDHYKESDQWISKIRGTWDDKESMLLGIPEDSMTAQSNSKIFDPRLSTIVFERAARVMSQNPKGKAYAKTKNDIGKNMLMNLLLNHYRKEANEQYSHLVKLRLLDLYSLVYGTMFALVPWRVNPRSGYIGPELVLINIRDAFPQPGVRNLDEADYFNVRTMTSAKWLEQQDGSVWDMDAIKSLVFELKEQKSTGDTNNGDSNKTSYLERALYPTNYGDVVYPKVELYTEYRDDKWITWSPQRINQKTSKPHVLRVVENPYPDGMLPIIAKHAFPLIDSPIGLGEFERGKSLQFAINSLVNMYMDGVKYSIFPPLAINAENVVPSSIKWGPGEKWFMNQPNVDLQPVELSPRGLDTFNSTYGYLLSALQNQAGTSDVSTSQNVESTLGKTPQALRLQASKEGSRDEWDRFMMEESIKDIYKRWVALSVDKMEGNVAVGLFEDEINEISQTHPDITEVFESGRGQVKINKKLITAKYDYELEAGSTVKPDLEGEQNNLTSIMTAVIENPNILQIMREKGKDVDFVELFKRWVISAGVKDWDKIVTDFVNPTSPIAPNTVPTSPEEQVQPNMVPEDMEAYPQEQMPMPESEGNFQDPDIAALASQLMGSLEGIPPS